MSLELRGEIRAGHTESGVDTIKMRETIRLGEVT